MQEGDGAPDFTLLDNNGNEVKLSSFQGQKNVVLCFYPKNHIFGCPSKKVFKMAENIISEHQKILDTNSILFAISIDNVDSQKKFVDEYSIPYPHLSDPTKETCKKYAGLNIAGMAKRSTFIIDKNGIIKRIFRDLDANNHGQEIVSFLENLSS